MPRVKSAARIRPPGLLRLHLGRVETAIMHPGCLDAVGMEEGEDEVPGVREISPHSDAVRAKARRDGCRQGVNGTHTYTARITLPTQRT